MTKLKVKVDNIEYDVAVEELGNGKLKISFGDETHEIETKEESNAAEKVGEVIEESEVNVIKAPLPGIIMAVEVKPGDEVRAGDPVVTLIAMKMENQVTSPRAGKVKEVKIKVNDTVESEQALIILEKA